MWVYMCDYKLNSDARTWTWQLPFNQAHFKQVILLHLFIVVAVVALPFVHFCSLTNLTAWAQNFTARSSHFARNPQTVKKRKTEKSQLKKNSKKAAAVSAWNYKTVGRKMLQSWTCWGMLMFMYESTRRRAHTFGGSQKKNKKESIRNS